MNRELPIVAKLTAEAAALTYELKIELPKQIETARAHGDLKENAEYHAAKERQGMVSARIGGITARLAELSRYNFDSIPREAIGYGSLVEAEDLETGESVTYQLVFAEEVDMASGKVSLTSPVGQALLNRREGDEVKIQLPSGVKAYEITSVETIHQREAREL
jgi:transcription elongation factor GreA